MKERFGPGSGSGGVLPCLNVQKRLWRVEWRQSRGEATPQQTKDEEQSHLQGHSPQDAPRLPSASQQRQRGVGVPESTLWAAALGFWHEEGTLGGGSATESLENLPGCVLKRCEQELLPGMHLGPVPPPSTSCVAVPPAASSFNQRRKTLRTQDSNPPGKVTDSPILQRRSLNIKNSIVVLATLI